MRGAPARRAADLLKLLAPQGLCVWVEAIRAEAEHLPNGNALRFVAASIPGLLVTFTRASITGALREVYREPRRLAALAATGAVGPGAAHMIAAGAPATMRVLNGIALALGLVSLFAMTSLRAFTLGNGEIVMIAIAAALLATSLFGVAAYGAVRWVDMGPVMIQPSLVLLPLLLMFFTRTVTAAGGERRRPLRHARASPSSPRCSLQRRDFLDLVARPPHARPCRLARRGAASLALRDSRTWGSRGQGPPRSLRSHLALHQCGRDGRRLSSAAGGLRRQCHPRIPSCRQPASERTGAWEDGNLKTAAARTRQH